MKRFERPLWAVLLALVAMMPVAFVVHTWNHNVVGMVLSGVGFAGSCSAMWDNRNRWRDG